MTPTAARDVSIRQSPHAPPPVAGGPAGPPRAAGIEDAASRTDRRPGEGEGPVDVVVAIPAHDEEAYIASCLASVTRALAHAHRVGTVRAARILVSAHRCGDDTAARAHVALTGLPSWCAGEVVVDEMPPPVGAVRHRLLARADDLPGTTWMFSTDADSRVPLDWVTEMLAAAHPTGGPRAAAVAGLVDVEHWHADPAAREAYTRLVEAGLTPTGHGHVYAANLVVRLADYRAVGGFPAPEHGEEHGLVAALRASGRHVATPRHPSVATSGRTPGRAAHGLGELLARIAEGATSRTTRTARTPPPRHRPTAHSASSPEPGRGMMSLMTSSDRGS
ncbi:glycosyltransferase [Mobilicoccus pelagius]|uniref:glycosyltransferase n=1 Tax=Mobilicoccus pelagius TaxID=746032 RepID=UPI0002E8BF78|nr:hypothetical protein [Mobilicoccus pelagius]